MNDPLADLLTECSEDSVNAEQIIDELYVAELNEPDRHKSPSYYYGFRDGAEALLKRLREASLLREPESGEDQ